ncbi:uncharacterized protein [Watersipora subatra]|uniref:uncharacterized protein n=1 Tax=Watersipora subatra TaxID=2589382 RepID=UPI00355B0C60
MKTEILFTVVLLSAFGTQGDPFDNQVLFGDIILDAGDSNAVAVDLSKSAFEGSLQDSLLPTVRMSAINSEANQQAIELPNFDCALQIYNQKAGGFLSVTGFNDSFSANHEPTNITKIGVSRVDKDPNTIFWRAKAETYSARLLSFITNEGIRLQNGSNQHLERLVMEGDRLVAKVTSEGKAAHFMVKRFPSLCTGDANRHDVISGALLVQLMLVDGHRPNMHRSLLSVEHTSEREVEFTVVPSSTPECSAKPSANVAPGTLFILSYKADCI